MSNTTPQQHTPKKYSGKRTLEQLKADCLKNGWGWSQEKYDQGSDYVTFGFRHDTKKITVIYNTFNGTFIVAQGKKMITECSTEMDAVPWYAALLDFIYTPATVEA